MNKQKFKNQLIKVGTQLTYTNGSTYEYIGEVILIDDDRFLITELNGHRHHLYNRMYITKSQIKNIL